MEQAATAAATPTDAFGNPPINWHDHENPTISERFMVGDLVKYLLPILKNQTVVWEQKTEAEQRQEIERLQNRVKQGVKQVVEMIAADGATKVRVTLGKFTIGAEGIKGDFTMSKSLAERHLLFDEAGEEVLIVLPQYKLALEGGRNPGTMRDEVNGVAAEEPSPQTELIDGNGEPVATEGETLLTFPGADGEAADEPAAEQGYEPDSGNTGSAEAPRKGRRAKETA